MSTDPELSRFVRDSLQNGKTQDETRQVLETAGWSPAEIDAALNAWLVLDGTGPVPRPVRSSSARDAFFHALLFIVFGTIVANVLVLWLGQINVRFPDETERLHSGQPSGLRWSIAALVVFLPVFWWLDRYDSRATRADPSLRFATVRRWLSAIALLCAVITLLTDALYLIYSWLDGQLTLRFLLKSGTVAIVALIVLAYFGENRRLPLGTGPIPAAGMMSVLAIAGIALTLNTIGGPSQGRTEQRDQARMRDLSALTNDLAQCQALSQLPLPESFSPMDCASNPGALTGFATDITYTRLATDRFRLCIDLESPEVATTSGLHVDGNTVCEERVLN